MSTSGFPAYPDSVQAALAAVRWDLDPDAVEAASFQIIEAENPALAHLPVSERRVARRIIHTSGDPALADRLMFRHDPVRSALAALRSRAPIFCDSTMIRSGLSLARLRRAHMDYAATDLFCAIAEPEIAARAKALGRTRAFCAAEAFLPQLSGAIVLVGNAPLALARMARACLEHGLRPALVVGMAVGFVNVLESKALLACCPVPQIVLDGRRGGSALAVATLHALLELLDEPEHDPAPRQ